MVGKTISHYKIVENIGKGGMGIVYKAEDNNLKRTVALKFLPTSFSSDEEAKKRFIHEARSASALDHPNICTIYEIGEAEDGQLFISMALYEGETLKEKISKGKIDFDEAIDIIRQICAGLEKAHQNNIVHKDIKPANIFITKEGIVKILDFGIAKVKGHTRLTLIGATAGTLEYMSPEQARGEEIDQRTDLWSAGVIMYEMLTGKAPFAADYDQAIIYSILNKEPDLTGIPKKLKGIITRAINKSLSKRYQNTEDLIIDLNLIENKSFRRNKLSVQKSPAKVTRNRTKFIYISTFIIAVVIASILYFKIGFVENENGVNRITIEQEQSKSLAVMYFENIIDPEDKYHTGEMLTNLISTTLSQYKKIEIISRERLLDIQREIEKTYTTKLSPVLAEQIARKANADMMLTGSVVQEKPKLIVTIRLNDVKTGNIIDSYQIKQFAASQIFELVDSLSYIMRKNLNLALANESEIKPVSEITTNSPEAYRAYIEGINLVNKIYFREAVAAFKLAVELDKNFAMAYSYLSIYEANPEKKAEYLKMAVKLSDRTTERERLQILARNYEYNNDFLKASETYEKIISKYPYEVSSFRSLAEIYKNVMLKPNKGMEVLKLGLKYNPSDKFIMNNLAYFYAFLNRRQDALNMVDKYINLAPAEPNPYDTKGEIYALFEQYDSSRIFVEKAFNLHNDFPGKLIGVYDLLNEKYADAETYFNISREKNFYIELYKGQFYKAINKIDLYLNNDEGNVNMLAKEIPSYYETGQFSKMLRLTKEYTRHFAKGSINEFVGKTYIAWALLKNGNGIEAHKILDELKIVAEKNAPIFQLILDYSAGVIFYEENNFELALAKFQKVFSILTPNHWPSIYFAVTLLKCNKTSDAIELLQRITKYPVEYGISIGWIPGLFEQWPIPSVTSHYWLGVAYEKQGKIEKAIQEYSRFLSTWKNADFDSPKLKDAAVRIENLQKQ